MFELPPVALSTHVADRRRPMAVRGRRDLRPCRGRSSAGCAFRADAIPWLVGLYITGAYWFTASTSFANPAVTIARALTDTFSGIRPADVPAFILAQLVGAVAGMALAGWLLRPSASRPTPRSPSGRRPRGRCS